MNKKELIEKTTKAISQQDSITNVLEELRSEIINLNQENIRLRSELEAFKPKEEEKVKEIIIKLDEDVISDNDKGSIKSIIVDDSIKDTNRIIVKPSVSKSIIDQNSAKIFEFFLGKNVILKIAGLLLILGFFSLGRIAYESMYDIGRVALIMGSGGIVFGIGYFFDKKEDVVLNNVFYSTGLILIHLSFLLAFSTYELIGFNFMLLINITLIGAAFLYFYNKRFDFMDGFLFTFYLYILMYISFKGYALIDADIIYYLGSVLLLALVAYIMFVYLVRFLEDKIYLEVILNVVLMITIVSSVFVILYYSAHSQYSFSSYLMMLFATSYFYLISIKNDKNHSLHNVVILGSTFILSALVALLASELINVFTDLNHNIISLIIIILLVPLYIYLYREDDSNINLISSTDIYALFISILVIFFSFNFGQFKEASTVPYYVHHVTFSVITVIVYLFYRYNDKLFYQLVKNGFLIILGFVTIKRFIGITTVAGFNDTLYSYWNIGDMFPRAANYGSSEYLIYIFTLLAGIALLVINKLYGKYKNLEHKDFSVFLYGFNLVLLIPIVYLVVNDLMSSTEERYSVVLLMSFSYIFIVYRYILSIKQLKLQGLKGFIIANQIMIVATVTITNFIYFDHHFGSGYDLLYFSLLLILNGYIVLSLKEIFDYYKERFNLESLFITIYFIGVFIHSMFIHRYINFDYDKVFLTSYFIIAAALAILFGFRNNLKLVRKIGLFAIYFALLKFFIYDFNSNDFTLTVRTFTLFILSALLFAIGFMYAKIEKKYNEEN
ncbi:MAG: hypothetical protein QM489_05715 [Candidatus Izemoplasma sp.]